MNILILIPMYKMMEAEAVKSLLEMCIDIHNKGDNYNIAVSNNISIALARNNMFKLVAESGQRYDYVLSIDTDHLYSAKKLYDLINKMEDNELELLLAAYFVRGISENKVRKFAHLKRNEKGVVTKIIYDPNNRPTGIIDVDIIGFGFVVLRPAFIKKIYDKHKVLFKMDPVDFTTEDVYFSKLVKEDGYRLCIDADTIIGHFMSVVNI